MDGCPSFRARALKDPRPPPIPGASPLSFCVLFARGPLKCGPSSFKAAGRSSSTRAPRLPHHPAAHTARDLGDGGPDLERRYAHTLVEDRELVLRAARALMLRIVGAAG